jgi:hypothetical protein
MVVDVACVNWLLMYHTCMCRELHFYLSCRVDYNGKNRILNGYHMSEINYFNFFTTHDDVAADARWLLMCHTCMCR